MRRVASGWETELTLAVDSVFPTWLLGPDIAAFREAEAPTRLRLIGEALSGTWEALLDRRADLLVGAPGEGPSGGGYVVEPLGTVAFVFAVAPDHPLANVQGVLGREQLVEHCAIAVSIRRAGCAAHGGPVDGAGDADRARHGQQIEAAVRRRGLRLARAMRACCGVASW